MAHPGKSRLLESSAVTRHPGSDEHLAFLVRLQRLLSEGDFTATYKYALLIALADIAVEQGHDDVRVLDISMRAIAEKFVGYYWQQTIPYRTDRDDVQEGVLHQNLGAPAKVVSDICRFRISTGAHTLVAARRHPAYSKLLTTVSQTVAAQPVTYMQNIGGTSDPFLYERVSRGVRLHLGVASHLRKFHSLIQDLARSRWTHHIKANKRNAVILDQQDDLQGFLFETSRQSLQAIGVGFVRLFSGRCFYCQHSISGTADVDHFIPFSMYGRDIGENFVLAHPACNRSKSDLLAAREHLEKWLEQIEARSDDLRQITDAAGVLSDSRKMLTVAEWAYTSGAQSGRHAWVRSARYEEITHDHVSLFGTRDN